MPYTEKYGHTWICRTQIIYNWARKTRTTIQKLTQWLRKGQKTGLVKLAYFQSSRGVHTLISQLKPKFNKSHFMNSTLSIPPTFSCALDSFLEKKKASCLFLPHFSN